mmetsp:Transcript_30982/g.28176  ORF Transcript_30982/g.28176 Transcript_30982/m.28176 type:complete len:169 (+) Transcript_30982:352-858(+)
MEDQNVKRSGKVSKYSMTLTPFAPNGDFLNLLDDISLIIDEKLARTFFHQLVSAVEHLHSHKAAHLDLKLENLVLDDECNLRIIDFDMSQFEDDEYLESRGTPYFRAPELKRCNGSLARPEKCDVYSLGVIAFTLVSRGVMPHLENEDIFGLNLEKLMYEDMDKFWKK